MTAFDGWDRVAERLDAQASEAEQLDDDNALLDEGQRASIRLIAERLRNGRRAILVADEVGMGKTRIAVAVIDAVRRSGGRAAIVMPAGLGAQWQRELRRFDRSDRTLLPLRSYESFIRGFGRDGDDDLAAGWQKKRDERLRDRRQQRELPEVNWRDEKILMISHAFARMSFPEREDGDLPWRRELMPALEAKSKKRRRNMRDGGRGKRRATHRAAEAAVETFDIQELEFERARDWRQIPSDAYRRAVLPVIGRALGRFDLIVIDEAHKARGEDSSLSRILGPLLWESEDRFRLGLTATPVELDADQWCNTLKRLIASKVAATDDETEDGLLSAVESPIRDYAATAKRLQTEPLCEELVAKFEQDAKAFSEALRPYVIRRDKRSDKELMAFRERYSVDYRNIRPVSVAPDDMGRDWLRAFCAAEALSLLPETDRSTKRRRLTIETGHGLDKLILEPADRNAARDLDFWSRNVLLQEGASIFEHPAIRAAVSTIEKATGEGRKVLVFGTLLTPLRALTGLLDARAMLRHLAEEWHWPASRVHADMVDAVRAALRMQDCPTGAPASVDDASRLLKERYDEAHKRRSQSLREIRREIITRAEQEDETAKLILQIWPAGTSDEGESKVALLLAALEERLARRSQAQDADGPTNWTAELFVREAEGLVAELCDGAGDAFLEEVSQSTEAPPKSRLQLLQDHLDDYSGREGNFARLLYGRTLPQTRRVLQAAFNREASWPMVLVAQSTVGREGLNLHEACRTVVLLHAEWNPGVVEQQIGRVDRKNSRFLKDYREGSWRSEGLPPPQIDIFCIQVDGGYDSHRWAVLQERWASLRAQLHGDIVSTKDREQARTTPELGELIKRLDCATPDFYPPMTDHQSQ